MALKLKRWPGRSPNWVLRGTVRGVYVWETTGTDDAEAADAVRIKREGAILDRSIFGPGATVTFEEAAVSYLAAGGEAKYLGKFDDDSGEWSLLIGHFLNTVIANIDQDAADAAAAKLYPSVKASTTKRCVYGPLCAVLNHAAAKKWCPRPSIKHPKVADPVTDFSSPERLQKLLPHCAPKLRRFVMVDTYTGGRLSELMRIDWDNDVFLARRTILLRRTKNGKPRAVWIPDPLLIELSTVPEDERHGPMFNWSDKTHIHKPLRNACKRAGVRYLPPHQQGRHTYATWMIDYAGLDLKALMDAGDWASVQSVVRYLHVVPGRAGREADKLPSVQIPCSPNVKPLKDRRIRKKFA